PISAAGEDVRPLRQQLHEGDVEHHPGGEPEPSGQHLRAGAAPQHPERGADAGGTAREEGEEEGDEHGTTLAAGSAAGGKEVLPRSGRPAPPGPRPPRLSPCLLPPRTWP